MNDLTKQKIEEYKSAINKYNNNIYYNKFGIIISILVIVLQMISIFNIYCSIDSINTISIFELILILFISYFLTDFINGFIHLYMDNNDRYNSFVGPFIAAFHQHHRKPKYKSRAFYQVYFYETGAKLWLPIYLLIVIYLQYVVNITIYFSLCLTFIGILSSFAEVSHYWCHNSRKENIIINILQKYRILLSKEHHKHHHIQDNINYAFLNGTTDWLLNIIAKYFFNGYKNHTDLHVRSYHGKDTLNRE